MINRHSWLSALSRGGRDDGASLTQKAHVVCGLIWTRRGIQFSTLPSFCIFLDQVHPQTSPPTSLAVGTIPPLETPRQQPDGRVLGLSSSVYSRCCIRIYSALVGVPHRPLLPLLPTRVHPHQNAATINFPPIGGLGGLPPPPALPSEVV